MGFLQAFSKFKLSLQAKIFEKTNDIKIKKKHNDQTARKFPDRLTDGGKDKRTSGQTLFHKTTIAIVKGPICLNML